MKKGLIKDKGLLPILILSFAVPLAVVCGALLLNHIAPFGDTSILIWDSKLQYKDYFGYLWEVLHGNASLEYSASKSLGGQMIGLVAYYLTCPLNLLVYFIDKSQISLFISVSTILKIAFAGLTAAYFVRKRYKVNPAASVVLASCYALMEYNVVYCRNIMWLDGAVLLPLACLGVYELLYNNKKGLLFFSVAIAIISNWYSGFMVCLMTGFYFLFELVLKYDYKNFKNVIKDAFLDAVRVAADMILGVLASCAVLLPACLSLVGGKAKFKLLYTTMNVGILECFKGFDINAASNKSDAPILYCGAIALIFALYLFFDKRIDMKKRICSALLFFFMIFSFCFKELDIMWTAFVQSHSYAFRWAFTFGFVMIMLAAMAISEIQKNKLDKSALFKALGVIAAVFLLLDLNGEFESKFIAHFYLFAIIFYAFAALFIAGIKNSKSKKYICMALVSVIAFAELGANATLAFGDFNESEKKFSDYTNEMAVVIDEIKEKDDSFYRLEKQVSYLTLVKRDVADSESFMFGYNGIENYTSTYDANVDEFMARMGYSDSTYVPGEDSEDEIINPTDVYWNCPMLLTDSLLGVKYQLLESSAAGLSEISLASKLPEGFKLYQNNYALPLAYNVSADLANALSYSRNPFENQAAFLSAALGEDVQIYSEPEIHYNGLKNNSEKITLTAAANGPMYFYTDASDDHSDLRKNNCELYVNGELIQPICKRFQLNAVYIGDYSAGESVNLEIKHISKEKNEHTVYAAQLDMNVFETAYNKLSGGSECNFNISGNALSGTYTTEIASTVMITLPYTEGWTLYIDGEKAEYKELGDTFIGIDLTEGTHEISMKYSTLHGRAGLAASFIGVAGFAAWCILDAVLKKKKK